MKKLNKIIMMSAMLLISTSTLAMAEMPKCAAQAFSNLPQELNWRKDATVTTQAGDLVATSAKREADIQKQKKKMEDEVLGRGMANDTPPMFLFPAEGVAHKFLHITKGDTQFPNRLSVSGLGASGILKATVLLPVSGHTSVADATKWKNTDTYSLKVDYSKDAEGKSWENLNSSNGSEAFLKPLVTDVKSQDYITHQEVEIPMKKGVGTRIIYYRSGSGGPGGYFDGRVIELLWDGT